MSRVLLVLRNGADARYVLNELKSLDGVLVRIVLESGKVARKKKLKRMLRGSLLHKLYVITVQVPLLLIYDRSLSFLMFRDYIPSKRYRDFDYFRIDDVNEQEFVTLVREFDPIIVLSFGTALYSSETLSQLRPPVLNLHTGILPEYRNVHTDFWAYIKNDFSGIGVTLFELTEKIDDGPIISEVRSEVTDEDYLWNVKRKNLSSVSSLIQNLMQQLDTPEFHLDSKSRDGANRNQSKPLWPTPSGGDLINYLIMEIAKVIRKHSPFKKNSEPYP